MFETLRKVFVFLICVAVFLGIVTLLKMYVLPVMDDPGGVVPDQINIPGK